MFRFNRCLILLLSLSRTLLATPDFRLHDTHINVTREASDPDSLYIHIRHELDDGLYLLSADSSRVLIPLPLYTDTLHMAVTSADSSYIDTVLSGFSSYHAPQLRLIASHPYALKWDNPPVTDLSAVFEGHFHTILNGQSSAMLMKETEAESQLLIFPEFPSDTDSLIVYGRYSSAIKWGQWSDTLTLSLNVLNTGPVFLGDSLQLNSVLQAGDILTLPTPEDVEGDLIDTLSIHLLYNSGQATVYYGPLTSSFRIETLIPDSLPDNQRYRFQFRLRDRRGKSGPPRQSTAFYYDRVNERPGPPDGLQFPDGRRLSAYPWHIQWKASTDPDPGDSILHYTVNFTEDAAGNLLLRQLQLEPDSLGLLIQKPFRDNSMLYLHIYAVDSRGSMGYPTLDSLYVDAFNDPPRPFRILSRADTLGPGSRIVWEAALDPNPGDSILHYTLSITDLQQNLTRLTALGPYPMARQGDTLSAELPRLDNHHRYSLNISAEDQGQMVTGSKDTLTVHYSDGTNRAPSQPLQLTPSITSMLDSTDILSWTQDPDRDGDPLTFLLQFSRDLNFSDSILTAAVSTDTLFRLDSLKNELEDDQWYFWRVRSQDGWGGYSPFSDAADFHFNREEDAPYWLDEQVHPRRGKVVKDSSFIISWAGIFDPDFEDRPEDMLYEIVFSRDTLSTAVKLLYTKGSSLTVQTGNMEENALYHYRIRAEDRRRLYSDWSSWNHFFINTVEEAPARVKHLLPPDQQILPVLGQLGWLRPEDPDPYDTLSYSILLSESPEFLGDTVLIRNLSGSLLSPYASTYSRISRWDRAEDLRNTRGYHYYQKGLIYALPSGPEQIIVQLNLLQEFKSLKENGHYYWKITAVDRSGLQSESQDISSFYLNRINEAPLAVQTVVYPAPGQILQDHSPTFFWKSSSDPDPLTDESEIRYVIRVFESDSLILSDTTAFGITTYTPKLTFEENGVYSWQLRPVDSYDFSGEWNSRQRFYINAEREAPVISLNSLSITDTTIFRDNFPQISWDAPRAVDPGTKLDSAYVEILIRFPDRQEERRHLLSALPVFSFRDSLPFYDNQWGYFRIRTMTVDSIFSPWSPEIRFGTDLYPEQPSPFRMLKPEMGQDTLKTRPTFKWSASSDPDLGDEISYTLFICEDSTFSEDVITIDRIYSTEYKLGPEDELYDNTRYFWKVKAVDRMGNESWGSQSDFNPWPFNVGYVSILDSDRFASGRVQFHGLQPNPFTNRVDFQYYLPFYTNVTLSVYNLRGQKVAVLLEEMQNRGEQTFSWDIENTGYGHLSAGMYIFILSAERQVLRQKGILIK